MLYLAETTEQFEEQLFVLLLSVTMSLVKKFFCRGRSKNTTSVQKGLNLSAGLDLCECPEEPLLQKDADDHSTLPSGRQKSKYRQVQTVTRKSPVESRTQESSSSKSASSSKCDPVISSSSGSTESSDHEIREQHRKTRRKWKSALQKYRKKEACLKRKQQELISMQNETREIMRLLHVCEMQSYALEEDIESKRVEMDSVCSTVTPDMEEEAKRHEPLCYKRYRNLKTTEDAKSLVQMIKNRQRALAYLEILALKKNMNLSRKPKYKDWKVIQGPLNKDRRNFDHVFRAVREQIVHEISEKLHNADLKSTARNTDPTSDGTPSQQNADLKSTVQNTDPASDVTPSQYHEGDNAPSLETDL